MTLASLEDLEDAIVSRGAVIHLFPDEEGWIVWLHHAADPGDFVMVTGLVSLAASLEKACELWDENEVRAVQPVASVGPPKPTRIGKPKSRAEREEEDEEDNPT